MRTMKKAIIRVVIFCLLITQMPVYGAKANEKNSLTTVPAGYTAIRTAEELRNIDGNLSGKYILMNDIDLSKVTAEGGDLDEGNGWRPIEKFRGVLDGNGYQIKGLHQFGNAGEANNYWCGFFADTSGAQIKNLGLTGCDITVQQTGFYIGVLVSEASSTDITNCYTTGTMRIVDSEARDTIYAGGMVGYGSGSTISNSFSTCNIICDNDQLQVGRDSAVGGICGSGGLLDHCYYAGSLAATRIRYCHPINGDSGSGKNTYYLKGCASLDGEKVTGGLSETQMKQKDSFAGFDFDSVWVIDENAKYKYPQLRSNLCYNLLALKIKQLPQEQTFECRDEFKATNGVVTLTYDNDYTCDIPITEDMISGYDMQKVGTYTVAVSYMGFVDHYDIEVKYVPVSSIVLSESGEVELEKTESLKMTASVLPLNATEPNVTWKSSDNRIVDVEKDGTVTGVGTGSAVVTVYSCDKKVRVQCAVNVVLREHQIRYVLNGGKNNADNPSSYTVDDDINLLPAVKKGYDFTGWYTDAELTDKISEIDVQKRSDYVLYAGWAETPYTVTYMDQKGQGYTHQNPNTITVGMGVLQLKDATRRGYDFIGWYLDEELSSKVVKLDCTKAENVKLYAGWKEIPYTVTYAGQGKQGYTHDNPYTFTITEGKIPLKDAQRKGYTFKNWYKDEELTEPVFEIDCTQAEDITLYAGWEENIYRIIYADESEQGYTHENPDTIKISTGKLVLTDAQRKGYDFTGWYLDKELTNKVTYVDCSKAENVTLYAGWTPIKYNITYIVNKGQNSKNNPDSYTVADGEVTLKDAVFRDYKFLGWYADDDYKEKITSIDTSLMKDITVYAKWEEPEYQIHLEDELGGHDPIVYRESQGKVSLTDIERAGAVFDGWYLDDQYTERVTEIDCTQCKDVTVYAKWILTKYKIEYKLDKGINDADNPSEYTVKDKEITLKAAVRGGYVFDGWYLESDYINKVEKINAEIMKNLVLYPKWNKDESDITYRIKSDSVTLNFRPSGFDYKMIVLPTRGKLQFAPHDSSYCRFSFFTSSQWNIITKGDSEEIGNLDIKDYYHVSDLSGEYAAGVYYLYMVPSVINWSSVTNKDEEINYTFYPKCTVYYSLDDKQTAIASYILQEDSEEMDITLPDIKGYTVEGLYFDTDYKEKACIDKWFGKDWVVYPKVTPVTYTVSYKLNGGENAEGNISEYTIKDSTFQLLDPVRDDYDFQGWYTDAAFRNKIDSIDPSGCKNLVLYAKWSAKEYTITYDMAGGTCTSANPAKYTINDSDFKLNEPVKTGYTFDGWYDTDGNKIVEIAAAERKSYSLMAKWKVNTYNITYNMEEGSVNDAGNPPSYTVEDENIVLKAPVRKGYVFDGWYNANGNKVGTINVSECISLVLTAKWTLARYTIRYIGDGADTMPDNPASYTVQSSTLPLQAPAKEGYTFDGWYISDGEKLAGIDPSVCSDLVLTAKWIKKDDSSNTGKDPSGDVDDNSGKTDQNQPGDDNSGKTDQNQPGDDNSGKTDQNQPGTTDSDQKTDTSKTDTSAGAGNKSDVTAGDDQNTTDTDDDEIIDDDDEEQIIVPATYICRKLVKKKSITVYMKARGVKGYQVRYSLKKNMAASKMKNSMKNKVVINNLKRKKMYYIQVRTWKTRNDQKKYSAWSRTYRIKTK